MLTILDLKDFDLFYTILEESFPSDERRDYFEQKALFDNPAYKVYSLRENDILKGFITLYELGEFIFIEHFAVNKEFRNLGLGSVILKEIISLYDKPIVLEVELPNTEIATKRIGFYKRNGFYYNEYPYIQPAYSTDKNAIPLSIMSAYKPLTKAEFKIVKSKLYKEIYKVTT